MRGRPMVILVILKPDILIIREAEVEGRRGPGEHSRVELGRVRLVGGRRRLVITYSSLHIE